MEIKDVLHPDCTLCAVQGTSKKRILELISNIASKHIVDIDQATILASLMNREKMGSTGIGNGIALPHGRLKDLKKVVAVVMTNDTPIEFDAIDKQPVDIFFAILVPEEQANEHLGTLSVIAAKLTDKDTLNRMRAAQSDEELFKVMN
ncbi:PTS IIA-like nitrogen regulatory protein PtsN [Paraglaciecola sp. 25GB23A]|jgi:nitrogen PTS system EIIA component|uniref:PTS IIA-like nitrogen regulatory protein PtsN n=1 Tax=Paraglaciecola sp. 25GB23A TaxID=3156068 RepID=UPI0032AE930C|tara:strand:- start:6617 stop:7060 length:444 start_codon:yes stop_codon:yes gene_type:complete